MALSLLSSSFLWSPASISLNYEQLKRFHPPKVSLSRNVISACVHVDRRSANYQPSFWNYDFITSLNSDYYLEDKDKIRAEELKAGVKHLLQGVTVRPVAKLDLINAIQRLGIGYHFDEEIKKIINQAYMDTHDQWLNDDLYSTALRFRLLRQHGYNVPQDVFDRFKNEMSNFNSCRSEDVKGILSLYEASYLGVEGENIMDEIRIHTTKFLRDVKGYNISPTLAKMVSHSLELPLHWRLPRVEARWYIDVYETEENMNPTLLKFSKLDYNMVQATHQKELSNLARWWLNSGLRDLSFSRDRLVEHFFWAMGMISEPQFGWSREWQTKVFALITIIDDMYDVYGSFEELELFTDAVERWDMNAIKQLPHYMKICYMALLNINNEIGYEVLRKQGFDITSHQKKAWVDLCKAYMVEANWFHSGYTPTLEEYLNNAMISIALGLLLLNCYFVTPEKITNEAIKYLEQLPSLICCSSVIVRLANDLGTSKDEQERGDVPKSIQCYMHEKGVSEEVARTHIKHLIGETWKKMNEAQFSQYPFSESSINAAVNLVRTAQCIYQYGDGHGNPKLFSDCLSSLLVEPISL